MLIRKQSLQQVLRLVLDQRIAQGCELDSESFRVRIKRAADSYDALYELALELRSPAVRSDWPYCEPLEWEEIQAQSPSLNPGKP